MGLNFLFLDQIGPQLIESELELRSQDTLSVLNQALVKMT